MNDDALFVDDDQATSAPPPNKNNTNIWRILVADDEPDVHRITRMVLSGFQFDGRRLEILSAYNGEETQKIMSENNDIAMILLDVVMEDDHAGLNAVRYIREDLNNHYTRIVLRTGQPGQAPEHEVIRTYDINDYKDKTELTTTKLNTLMYATLRSYRDICTLAQHRTGLERVIKASAEVLHSGAINQFATAVLEQVTNLLGIEQSALYFSNSTQLQDHLFDLRRFHVLAATGEMHEFSESDSLNSIPEDIRAGFEQAMLERRSLYFNDFYIGYFESKRGSESVLYVKYTREPSKFDKQLLEIYATNVAITYENILMHEEILETQRELVYVLGEAVETRSKETGAHVQRVAQISYLLAKLYGLSDIEAELIRLASPLHDVGKIAIPDLILNKPGKYTDDEREIMKTHALLGESILERSQRRILKLAAIIAGQHHEHWDGNGYPRNLKGEDIHIAGRITALADVFDALGSKRCYKDNWDLDDIVKFIQDLSGKQFDPTLVSVLIDNIDTINVIREKYPDYDN